MPDAEELNPHNLLSHLTHTQSIHPVIALLWEADVRLPWFSCVRGRGVQGETGERNIVDRTRVAG